MTKTRNFIGGMLSLALLFVVFAMIVRPVVGSYLSAMQERDAAFTIGRISEERYLANNYKTLCPARCFIYRETHQIPGFERVCQKARTGKTQSSASKAFALSLLPLFHSLSDA